MAQIPSSVTPNPSAAPARSTGRTALVLILLVLAGIAVRLPRLTESLWYDEIAAWTDYGMLGFPGDGTERRGPIAIATTYHDPANHVAHTLLSWISVALLERSLGSELALRLPALLFSLGAIPVMFAACRRVRASGPLALLAAGYVAFAPVAVLSGAEARGYSMMVFSAAASAGALLALLDAPAGRAAAVRGAIYAACAALGVWAHAITAFASAGHAVAMTKRPVRVAAAIAGAAALSLLLYAPIAGDVARTARRFGGAVAGSPSMLGAEGWHAVLQLGGAWAWWAAAPGLVLAAIGLRALGDARTRLAALVMLAGLPAYAIAVVAAGSWMYARFALFALPGAALLAALGVEVLWRRAKLLGAAALVVTLAAWGADLALRPPKQPIRDAVRLVADRAAPDDRLLVVGLRHDVADVYAKPLGLAASTSLHHGAALASDLDAAAPAWVIVLYPRSVGAARLALLEQRGYRLERSFAGWVDWSNGDVLVYRRGP
jgi:hypothetical protein